MTFKEQELNEIHQLIVEALLKKHPDTAVKLWFGDLKLASLTLEEAIFIAPTTLKKTIIENKFSIAIRLFVFLMKENVVWIFSFHKRPFQLRQHLMSKGLPCEFSTATSVDRTKVCLVGM